MRILFYIEPLIEKNMPNWKDGWFSTFVNDIINTLQENTMHKYDFRIMLNEPLHLLHSDLHKKNQIVLTQKELFEPFPKYTNYLDISLKWFQNTYSQDELRYYEDLMITKLDNFVPDICISFTPIPFLKNAFKEALILYHEFAMFSRAPYPATWFFDPINVGSGGGCAYVSSYQKAINSIELTLEQENLVKIFKMEVQKLISVKNPFKKHINEYKSKFDYLVLLPLQDSGYYQFEAYTGYKSQYEYLIDVLENIPDNIGVIVTTHPEYNILTEQVKEYLQKKYKNFINSNNFEKYYASSQFLIEYVDAVIVVSTSVGLNTLIWDKKLISLGKNFLDFMSDSNTLENIGNVIQQKNKNKEQFLFWICTRYAIPENYLKSSEWLTSFLEKSFLKRNKIDETFYDMIDSDINVFKALSEQLSINIPLLTNNCLFIQLFTDSGVGISEEGSRKFIVEQNTEIQEFIFELTDKSNINNIRLDPLNDSCEIEIESLRLLKEDGEIDLFSFIKTNACGYYDKSHLFDSIDPQIYFEGFSSDDLHGAQKLIARIRYIHVGEEVLKIIVDQKENYINEQRERERELHERLNLTQEEMRELEQNWNEKLLESNRLFEAKRQEFEHQSQLLQQAIEQAQIDKTALIMDMSEKERIRTQEQAQRERELHERLNLTQEEMRELLALAHDWEKVSIGLLSEIKNIQHSFSWRITSPIRTVANWFSTNEEEEIKIFPSDIQNITHVNSQSLQSDDSNFKSEPNTQSKEQPMLSQSKNYSHIKTLDEILSLYDEDFVNAAYQLLLKRNPDPEGFQYYLGRIRKGISKLDILGELRNSSEGQKHPEPFANLDSSIQKYRRSKWPIIGRWFVDYAQENQRKLQMVENQLHIIDVTSKHRFNYLVSTFGRLQHDILSIKEEINSSNIVVNEVVANVTEVKHDSLVNNDDYETVRQSGLFDFNYYLETYPDVALAGIDPIEHYLSDGWNEGRSPSIDFDTNFYLATYPDIGNTEINPFVHYIRYGLEEGRIALTINSVQDVETINDLFNENILIPHFKTQKPIDIIIPIYNGFEFLEPLLKSIIKNTSMDYKIIVCDDKSSDEKVLPLLKHFKEQNPLVDITLLENEQNLGFIKTVNKLVKYTNNHFVLLNTDTEVPPHWIERLMYPIFEMKHIASTTPFTNAGTICSFPNYLEDNPIFANMTVEELDSYFQYVNFEKTYIEIPTGVGFCMGVNKNLVDKIGMFDEIFGKGYSEENDWCQRAIRERYKNIHVTNLFVYHKHGGSFPSEEKTELLKKNSQILETKHPMYMIQVSKLVNNNALDNLREFIKYRILSDKYKAIIIFEHSLGGGANEYTKMKVLNEEIAIIIAYNPIMNNFIVTFCGNKLFEPKMFQADRLDIVFTLIDTLKFSKIIINNFVSYLNVFELLKRIENLVLSRKSVDLDVLIHDYYFICPMYNLLNEKTEFCGIPSDLEVCNKCLKSNQLIDSQVGYIRNDYPNLDIRTWRENFGTLLNLADSILVFSNSSIDIITKAFPSLNKKAIKLIPHNVDWVRPTNITKSKNIYNFAIIGNMSLHKGIKVVADLASYIDSNGIPVKLHFFGDIPAHIIGEIQFGCVVEHGRYDKFQLPKLMEKNQIDLIFIPSIWPETFSYTTEEAIKMNISVAVFDLGAPAERIKEYDKGIILGEFNSKTIIDLLIGNCKKQSLKETGLIHIKNNANNKILIHQIYYDESQYVLLNKGFIPYYNPVSESSKIWHENEVFFKEYLSGGIGNSGLYGYLSWRFEEKTQISALEFIDFIDKNPDYDVYFINPFPELADVFPNVWDQGEFHHPGINSLVKLLFNHVGISINLDAMINNQDTLLYCNYWVGNKKFWDAYMKFTLPIFNYLNGLTEEELTKYTANSGYHTAVGFVTFIMERMFSTFLVYAENINAKPYIYDKAQIGKLIMSLRMKCGQ